MNDLEKYFNENTGRLIHKWKHYFEIYDRHFSRFRGREVHLVEFGVSHGGSLQMWKEYFGPQSRIYGIDINPHCKQFEEEGIKVFIGDQESRAFLKSLVASIPKIDILIDDGGHTMKQQIHTFEELFEHIDADGIYLCEDLLTSYDPKWGGGYKKKSSFIEYSKNFIDSINAWHSKQKRKLKVSDFTTCAHSLHYYDSVLVIEKRVIEKPYHLKTGTEQIPNYHAPKGFLKRMEQKLRRLRR